MGSQFKRSVTSSFRWHLQICRLRRAVPQLSCASTRSGLPRPPPRWMRAILRVIRQHAPCLR